MNIYDYQRLVGKIEDVPELRNEFIKIFDVKTKHDMARWGLLYAEHILEITGLEPCDEVRHMFEAVQRWIDGKANYRESRNIAFYSFNKDAHGQTELIKKKFYKTMAQITCIPHVKAHALWATDMAITLINQMHPHDLAAVQKERENQIEKLKYIKANNREDVSSNLAVRFGADKRSYSLIKTTRFSAIF
ncbi:MAG: hypothetical protein LBQ27_01330 [Clostridiales bacterium]|jgi:hypothetical protein|nr:hypothetical protein [Clostridiales bacterium]